MVRVSTAPDDGTAADTHSTAPADIARDANAEGAPPVRILWEKRPHLSLCPPEVGGVYMHYKGKCYTVVGFGRRRLSVPPNGRESPIGVLYAATEPVGKADLFLRDLSDWNAKIGETLRFTPFRLPSRA